MNIVLLGGDRRHGRLGELLGLDGHSVSAFGMEELDLNNIVKKFDLGEKPAEKADILVLPLPLSADGVFLNTPFSAAKIRLEDVVKNVRRDLPVLAGNAGADFREAAAAAGLQLVDYFNREELVILNANATAEAALGILMKERQTTLFGSRVLITGFGRIGKILAMRLKSLGARVTVSARRDADFAWIKVMRVQAADTRRLGDVSQYDVVINTVPHMVFDESLIKGLNKNCFCVDLASEPGGIDFAAAERHGIKNVWARSLPGKMVPDSAAAIIRDTIYNIIEELECSH